MALSKKAREILEVAMADRKAAKEVADAIDAAQNEDVSEQLEALSDAIDALDARVEALENV